MHLSGIFSIAALATAAAAGPAAPHSPNERRQSRPPTNDPLPESFRCDHLGLHNCAAIGNALDRALPDDESQSLTLGPNESRELDCDRPLGGDRSIAIANGFDSPVTIEWAEIRRRLGDVASICSDPANSNTPSVTDCNGQTYYADGTTAIARSGCFG